MISWLFISFVKFYRFLVSPFLGSRCRFYPSCSEYALEAFQSLTLLRAMRKVFWRLLRCGPWAKGGIDFLNPVSAKSKEDL